MKMNKFNLDKMSFDESELAKVDVKKLFCENHDTLVSCLEKLKDVTKNPIFDFIIELALDIEQKVFEKTCS
jgi:uncharacterized protein YjgD (DUF1641 family)